MVESFKPREQAHLRLNGLLTLPFFEAALKSPQILSHFSIVSDLGRRVEWVGSAYEKLKAKVHK